MRRRALIAALVGAWAAGIAVGMKSLWDYQTRPGVAAEAPELWPSESHVMRHDGFTLVMLAHPMCPCTRASLTELAALMERHRGRVAATVLFLVPRDHPDWRETDTVRQASSIPGVEVVRDEDGVEAARFRAHTSGQTMLYDREGRLAFAGGITGVRGHAGDNAGRARVEALVDGAPPDSARSLVFGCPLGT